MGFKYMITDIQHAQENKIYGKQKYPPYTIVSYNIDNKKMTFGGRVRHTEHILETVKNLFYLEDEYISEAKFNQGINVRFEVEDLDFKIFNDVMQVVKGSDHYRRQDVKQLKRLM